MSEDDAVHYRLRLGQEEHHLELYPSHRLCGPAAVIEEHRSGKGDGKDFLDNLKIRRMRDGLCHYQGRVRHQPGASALSTCYGLVGYIRTKYSWYTIEPVRGHDFTKEAEHPHIVYERNPKDVKADKEFLCHAIGDLNRTIAKRASNRQPRKRVSKEKSHETSRKYIIELLVVLDRALLRYHQEFDVENYVLTLLNMAAGLFHDKSLNLEIDLAIVRIIRLEVEENEMNLEISKDAEATLKQFQEWQRLLNPSEDNHPNHHDLAILLTRVDFCVTGELCGFTGMSTIGGTCDPLKGAIVVKDSGLQTGFHIAHHIGHSAGMGHCLEDEPRDSAFPTMEMLPGVIYNGNFQCRLRYRWDAVQCDLGIWCYNMKCVVIGERLGAIDGNWSGWSPWSRCSRTCGSGVAFSTRRCDHPAPSNGGSYCPGIRKRHKICATNPCGNDAPSFRDVQCSEFNDWVFPEDGKVHRWEAYNLPKMALSKELKAPGSLSLEMLDVSSGLKRPFPVFPAFLLSSFHLFLSFALIPNDSPQLDLKASENPCALYCLSDTGLVTSLRPKVVDGTTCYRGIRDICVAGVCREIPCDLNMESNAVEDVCGVCRGDSTSCRIKEGTITLHAQSSLLIGR
ncbi:hypothetical protein KPH14_006737 [Odynerus spinipes]|uniref:Peptidase M12B domain-containing protein n=1 Tax=Odynerus spinipes TaxID=1348599 RepID=A0AAD9RR13_9HYME|nr:hypothetical protein KPH14_006737 [Odynerus spinipes]